MVKNIVFTGSALKCWAYIGTIRALYESKLNDIEQVIGVSGGSIFGLFYVLGIEWEFLLDYFMNLDFKKMLDIDLDTFMVRQSLLIGEEFANTIKYIMKSKIDPELTFKELSKCCKIKFTVNALNVTNSILEYFNYELTPDIKVIDALIASCSLPILFPPCIINNKIYYDGGFCNNCPVDITDEVDTIAFNTSFYDDINENSNHIRALIVSLITINNRKSNESDYNIYTILDKTYNKYAFKLNQTRDEIFNMYMQGYINSKNIIFKNHLTLPAP